MNLAEYASHDGLGLAALVRAGEVTPRQLALLAIEGAAPVNPSLCAMVETFAEKAERLRLEDVPDGPFRGVPFLLKDLGAMEAGVRCELGSRLAAGLVADHDSELGRRFRRAGLVSVGRATTSEFGIAGITETLAVGRTCSPWSAGHMAGGSSGGSGAAVGAGIVPVAHASDGGGSIRIPASACGVVGLKPTRGRVSPAPDAGDPLSGWAVRFAVTRTVRDTAALLDAVHGPAPGDPHVAPPPARPFLDEVGAPPGRLRIAYCSRPWSDKPAHPDVVAAVEATAALLADLGHDLAADEPPLDWEPFLEAMTDMWAAHTAHGIDAVATALGRTPGLDNLERVTYGFWLHGRSITAQRLLDCLDYFNTVCRRVAPLFETYDVLLTPTLGHPPAPLGGYDPDTAVAPRDFFDSSSHLDGFLPLFNCTGQPAISLPLCRSPDGLPLGMQLVGRFGDEATLLRLAAQLEEAQPWRDRRPPVHVGVG